MAELLNVSTDSISPHLKNIFADEELEELLVTEDSSITAADGKSYLTKVYKLDAILAVGYRVRSPRGVQFRRWASTILKSAIQVHFIWPTTSAEKLRKRRKPISRTRPRSKRWSKNSSTAGILD